MFCDCTVPFRSDSRSPRPTGRLGGAMGPLFKAEGAAGGAEGVRWAAARQEHVHRHTELLEAQVRVTADPYRQAGHAHCRQCSKTFVWRPSRLVPA